MIAQTSGAILMINESNYTVRSKSGFNIYNVIQPNLDGFVHVQIMRAILPSASTYMQLNFIATELKSKGH